MGLTWRTPWQEVNIAGRELSYWEQLVFLHSLCLPLPKRHIPLLARFWMAQAPLPPLTPRPFAPSANLAGAKVALERSWRSSPWLCCLPVVCPPSPPPDPQPRCKARQMFLGPACLFCPRQGLQSSAPLDLFSRTWASLTAGGGGGEGPVKPLPIHLPTAPLLQEPPP